MSACNAPSETPFSRNKARATDQSTCLARARALHALAGEADEIRAVSRSMPSPRAAATIACASGCSDSASTLAATRKTSSSDHAVPQRHPLDAGWPSVSVPVLSNITTSIVSAALQRLAVLDQDAAPGAKRRSRP